MLFRILISILSIQVSFAQICDTVIKNTIYTSYISYELKINEEFDTGILATQLKRPGEIIDNWTNISINDNMFLEGKYGAINAVIKHNNNIFFKKYI